MVGDHSVFHGSRRPVLHGGTSIKGISSIHKKGFKKIRFDEQFSVKRLDFGFNKKNDSFVWVYQQILQEIHWVWQLPGLHRSTKEIVQVWETSIFCFAA